MRGRPNFRLLAQVPRIALRGSSGQTQTPAQCHRSRAACFAGIGFGTETPAQVAGTASRVERMMSARPILVAATSPTSAEAESVSLRYYEHIVSRYHGRPALRQEILDAQAGYPGDDLIAPTGLLLLARQGPTVLGCAGMRIRPGEIGEVTRVFVEPAARGQGVGRLLMQNLERESRTLGLTALRLDTRTDLVEARSLYTSLGYIEGEPHNADPYANHWFRKELSPRFPARLEVAWSVMGSGWEPPGSRLVLAGTHGGRCR